MNPSVTVKHFKTSNYTTKNMLSMVIC